MIKRLLMLLLCLSLSLSLLACSSPEEPDDPEQTPGDSPDDGNDDAPPHKHSYGEIWLKNSAGHWQFCDCGEKSDTQPHTLSDWELVGSDEENLYYSRKCTVCGYTESKSEPIPPHEHNFGEEWIISSNRHWRECECGEKTDAGDHEYTDWEIRTDDDGRYYYRECVHCHKSQSEPCFDNVEDDGPPTNPDSPPDGEFDLPEIDIE